MDEWLFNKVHLAAIEVYSELGSGHTESVYESALEIEFGLLDLGSVRRQVPCSISYKGCMVGIGLIDILVDNMLIVEIKAIAKLTDKEATQVKKYLSGMNLEEGLLINFGPYRLEIEKVFNTQIKDSNVNTIGTED